MSYESNLNQFLGSMGPFIGACGNLLLNSVCNFVALRPPKDRR